ncbi:hypothetical protein [Malacoplasma iowae]|uniref:hypothetical protein n=1 Tax=Malacoplasma iowae TaxID=2116 RepID=UPI002A18AC0E|nr:hypothetical protein [Malacoplasma iowae]WPL36734.1 hypothetical protein QX179_04910 [Malacoplasma iowae]WPL37951.1 hypothetical protein QX182_00270 [Malacoplasma iowae]
MIKAIYFKKTDSLDESEGLIKIDFDRHINVIVGPKGGGKSTLFDLLASIKNGYLPSNVIDALKNHGLEFVKAEEFNGETILSSTLSKKNEKDKFNDFYKRNDVIFQDDPIKKDLNKSDDIEKEKYNYAKEIVQKQFDKVSNIINRIQNFYNMIYSLINGSHNSINWANTFNFKKTKDDLNIISHLNFSISKFKSLKDIETKNINKIIENSKEQIGLMKSFKENIDLTSVYKDDKFNSDYQKILGNIIENHNQLTQLLLNRNKLTKKIANVFDAFNIAYIRQINKIKELDYNNQGLKTFEKASKDYFANFAKQIIKLKKIFYELTNTSLEIKFDKEELEHTFLTYKMPQDGVKFDDDFIYDLLKIVLNTPKSEKDLYRWIHENQKETKSKKDFDQNKIINKISKELVNFVQVYADGYDYKTLSLGQRSIYGIKYKLKRSNNQDLFLDQPEDNLDNNTIATTILDLIQERKEQQVFIVTHNANIGILSNPEKVIVADLNNKINPYQEGKISLDKNSNDTTTTFYLEGGFKYLEARYIKAKGEN